MIKAIFYSKFDTQEGPKVVHQVPDGAIVPSPTAQPNQLQLVTFPDIQFFVIPRQELCGNFIYVCSNGYRILGCPICLTSPRYDRNQFIFNFCIVLSENEEFTSFKSVVLKLADLMCSLEEQSGFLSRDHSKGGTGKIHSLCETLMEDLNNYCECMIPIDDLNTLNVKLFPLYPPPPQVKAWQVPLFIVRYEAFTDENWDLTLQKIVPFINGVNSILMISVLSDVDFALTCRAIRHLVYYGCVFLLDIFSFSAIYAPTAQFGLTIAVDEEMQRECAGYVNMRFAPSQPSVPADPIVVSSPVGSVPMPGSPKSIVQRRSQTQGKGPEGKNMDDMLEDVWPELDVPGPVDPLHKRTIDGVGIVELYADLRQGKTVKQWYLQNAEKLANIDVRRFITFGIIKGFLYRVHKYAIATNEPAPHLMHTYSSGQSLAYRNRFPPAASLTEAQASNKLRRMLGDQDHPHPHHHHHHHPHHVHTTGPCSIIGDGDSAHLDVGVAGDRDTKDWDEDEDDPVDDRTLAKYLNGTHCFDQICMELEMTDSELMMRLKRYPYVVQVIHR